jgi:hypothetical protein
MSHFHAMDSDADRLVEAGDRPLQGTEPDGDRVGDTNALWWWGVAAAGRKGCRGEGDAGDQDGDEICAFCKQAEDRAGISGFGT